MLSLSLLPSGEAAIIGLDSGFHMDRNDWKRLQWEQAMAGCACGNGAAHVDIVVEDFPDM
jgi:hypothetical protein